MEIFAPSIRRSVRGSILEYRTPAEYFSGDPSLALCCPLRDSGMDTVSGNHINLTNVKFSEGAAYFNGVNAFGVTSRTLDLSGTNKVTVLVDVKLKVYPLTSAMLVLEHSVNYALNNAFLIGPDGTVVNDPWHSALHGNVGINYADYNKSNYVGLDLNRHSYAATFDMSLSTNEANLFSDGNLLVPSTRPLNVNNTENLGNYFTYIGMRAGTLYPLNGSVSDLAILKRIVSAEENAEYYAWMNDARSPHFFSLFGVASIDAPAKKSEKHNPPSHAKKVKIHPSPDIPVRVQKRIEALAKSATESKANYPEIVRELEKISAEIQEAINISSSLVTEFEATSIVQEAEDIALESRIGPKSMTARLANEKQRVEAFARARAIQAEAERVAEIARQEEFRMVSKAMETIIQMLD
jgi:hypothetical protein